MYCYSLRVLEPVVTENLFRDGFLALDLASLNIQRGRDHGVSYCEARRGLDLEIPSSFEHARQLNLFTQEAVDALTSVYEYVFLQGNG